MCVICFREYPLQFVRHKAVRCILPSYTLTLTSLAVKSVSIPASIFFYGTLTDGCPDPDVDDSSDDAVQGNELPVSINRMPFPSANMQNGRI